MNHQPSTINRPPYPYHSHAIFAGFSNEEIPLGFKTICRRLGSVECKFYIALLAFPSSDAYFDIVKELVMVSAIEARKRIVDSITPVSSEPCPLQGCGGRILAIDVSAPHDVPLFNNSGMDGYAVQAGDVLKASSENPVDLKPLGEVPAGKPFTDQVAPGTAIRIMTGAPVPDGADAVIEQELTETRNGMVRVQAPARIGRNIRKRGEDIRAGSIVLKKGTRMNPAAVGVLASLGILSVDVYRQPSVAILTTGDELVDAAETPGPGQIRNSNAFTLSELVRNCGAVPVNLGIVRDTRNELSSAVRKALEADAVITSGGVSVGAFDLVLDVLKSEGVAIQFWKVNIKPGMPLAYGIKKRNGKTVPVVALPGNPVSSMVTFLQFVRPGLEKLSGIPAPGLPLRIRAILAETLSKKDHKRHFVRGIAGNDGDQIVVATTGSQSSGVLTSMVAANCLIVLPEDAGDLKAGDSVEVELL